MSSIPKTERSDYHDDSKPAFFLNSKKARKPAAHTIDKVLYGLCFPSLYLDGLGKIPTNYQAPSRVCWDLVHASKAFEMSSNDQPSSLYVVTSCYKSSTLHGTQAKHLLRLSASTGRSMLAL